jgi:hypothetical protein
MLSQTSPQGAGAVVTQSPSLLLGLWFARLWEGRNLALPEWPDSLVWG